jgi:formylglycine-generating enzyme required for sulfatase activity
LPSSDEKREKLAKRQTSAAVALLRMGQPGKVWPLLKRTPPDDPRVRSYLIHSLSPLGADAGAIIKRLDEEPDITIRRTLFLSLGEFSEEQLPADARTSLLPRLKEIYGNENDPGLHACVEWLLQHWKKNGWLKQMNDGWAKNEKERNGRIETIQQLLKKGTEKPPPQWYINSQGQTMVVIPGPVEFLMGSPPTEDGRQAVESQHKRRVGRTFALAAKSVSLEQYRKFDAHYGIGEVEQWARTGDSPVIGTSWFQAAAYCNWLSKQEGLPEGQWCYEPFRDPKAIPALAASSVGLLAGALGPLAASSGVFPGRIDPKYKEGMKLAPNYLERTGYRLPTEVEMEYAIRAGAVTSRYFGETEELLERFAWYEKNSQNRTWPVGGKKPNDLGLFDMQGNVWSWCQESYKSYPKADKEAIIEDKEDTLSVDPRTSRVLRGGSFLSQAVIVRSPDRNRDVPTDRNSGIGFRPARTFTP